MRVFVFLFMSVMLHLHCVSLFVHIPTRPLLALDEKSSAHAQPGGYISSATDRDDDALIPSLSSYTHQREGKVLLVRSNTIFKLLSCVFMSFVFLASGTVLLNKNQTDAIHLVERL